MCDWSKKKTKKKQTLAILLCESTSKKSHWSVTNFLDDLWPSRAVIIYNRGLSLLSVQEENWTPSRLKPLSGLISLVCIFFIVEFFLFTSFSGGLPLRVSLGKLFRSLLALSHKPPDTFIFDSSFRIINNLLLIYLFVCIWGWQEGRNVFVCSSCETKKWLLFYSSVQHSRNWHYFGRLLQHVLLSWM